MRRLLLLGGGYSLNRLAERLPPESFIITTTSEEKCAAFARRGIAAAVLRLEDPASLGALLDAHPGIDCVIDSVPPRSEAAAREEALAAGRLLAGRGVGRLIYLSSTGVYGVTSGEWVDEDSPLAPRSPAAEARRDAELGYGESGLGVCVLRLSGIYGPGRGIGAALAAGRYTLVDGGSRFTNRIHVDDIALVLERAVFHPFSSPLPRTLCVSDDEPALAAEVVRYYCSTFGLPEPKSVTLAEAETRGMIHALGNQRVANRRVKEFFGIELQYPNYRAGAGSEYILSL